HERLKRDGQRILPEADLDCDFPITRGADVLMVERVGDEAQSGGTQSRVRQDEPEERMSIQEQSHSMYSWKSARWSSSSARMVRIPLAVPGWQGQDLRGGATKVATRWPSRVIWSSSPGTRVETSSGNRAWASAIVMACMLGLLRSLSDAKYHFYCTSDRFPSGWGPEEVTATFFRPVWAKLAAKLLRGDCEEPLTAED